MKHISSLFLKIVLVLIGIGVLAALIWFPHTEGRAKDLDVVSIYLDPVIAYVYIASIAFFVALFQAIKLLGFVEKNTIFSTPAVKAVRNIRYCALTIICFIIGAQIFLMFAGEEDKAGPIALGIYMIFITSIVIATVNIFEKLLQNAITLYPKK